MDEIKNIVHSVIGSLSLKKTETSGEMDQFLDRLLNEKEKKHVMVGGIKEDKLFLIVDSPAWHYAMRMKKKKMLAVIQGKIPEIKDIRFKIGKVD